MRRPILAANWKMQKTVGEALSFTTAFLPLVKDLEGVDVVIAPPLTALERVAEAVTGSGIGVAAQNVHPEPKGAFTGEVSAEMLADLGCSYTIVGHSERRALFAETDAFIGSKAAALLEHGVRPIVCVGETLEQREADRTIQVIGDQLSGSLVSIPAARAEEVVVAYEPVWAIGTGRTATPEMAQEVHGFIRKRLTELFPGSGEAMRIQYGGSVKPENVYDLMAQPDVDGALVGGASLDPESFAKIVFFDQQGGER